MRRYTRYGFLLARRAGVRAKREEGSALLEFGLALVFVLIPMLIGIIYGGIMFYDNVVLANAVAVGARTLATSEGDITVCADAESALTSAAYGLKTSQISIAAPTFTTAGGSAGLSSCTQTTGKNQAGTTCTVAAPCQIIYGGEFATVTATYPCSMYFPNLGINLCPVQGVGTKSPSPTCTKSAYCITSTATVRIE